MSENAQKPRIRFKGFSDAWEQRKLGEIGEFKSNGVDKLSKPDEYPVNLLNYMDVYSRRNITSINCNELMHATAKSQQIKDNNVVENDVFFTPTSETADDIGHVMVIEETLENTVYSYHLMRFRPFVGKMYKTFPNYGFATNCVRTQMSVLAQGVQRFVLSKGQFESINVAIPKFEEQGKIAVFMGNIDNLITLHQRKYDKLVAVKKSLLEKMFPSDGETVPKIRFRGFSDAWEQRKLSELTSMHARIGWQNLRTSEFLKNGDYMLITGTDFDDGAINYSTCHYVDRERYEQDKNIQIRNGSILITKDGTLGKVAYVQGLSMPATLNAGVFNVQIKDSNLVDEKYLFQYLKAPYLMDYVGKKATGGTIKHLNQNILVDFPIFMPKKSEQIMIGAYYQQLDNLITLHQRQLEKLKNIKSALLEKMFV